MAFNPFEQKPEKIEKGFCDLSKLYPKSYDKSSVDPYTKTRIILANGTEFESVYGCHNFSRNCPDNDLRRELATIRKVEQMQQKRIGALKPINESILETTISYEQLAIDLTAEMAIKETDDNVKNALNFALLEDFDHLYRYANLLEMDEHIKAENLVGCYTEIMPGRPTIAEHRHPKDDIRYWIDNKTVNPITKLHASIITAAEQQTMNFYMNMAPYYKNDLGRKLYSEIALIEEQHVTQYGSLKDTTCTYLENMLNHEYTECYLYYSLLNDESDERIKKIWEQHLNQEIAHLHLIAKLLKKYEKRDWQEIIPNPEFPQLLHLGSHIDYIRKIIKQTINLTSEDEEYIDVNKYKGNALIKYQDTVCKNPDQIASHTVITNYIKQNGKDYRYQEEDHPIKELTDRTTDNTTIARNQANIKQ